MTANLENAKIGETIEYLACGYKRSAVVLAKKNGRLLLKNGNTISHIEKNGFNIEAWVGPSENTISAIEKKWNIKI